MKSIAYSGTDTTYCTTNFDDIALALFFGRKYPISKISLCSSGHPSNCINA